MTHTDPGENIFPKLFDVWESKNSWHSPHVPATRDSLSWSEWGREWRYHPSQCPLQQHCHPSHLDHPQCHHDTGHDLSHPDIITSKIFMTDKQNPCPSSRSHLPESDTLQTCHNSSSVILISTFKRAACVNFQRGISRPRSASFLRHGAEESMLVCIQLQTFYSTFRRISNKTPATSKSATGSTSRYAILTVNIFLTDYRKSSHASSPWSLCCDHIWSVFSCVQYQAFWARIFLHLPTSTSHLIRLSWSFLFGNLLAVCFTARIEFIGV